MHAARVLGALGGVAAFARPAFARPAALALACALAGAANLTARGRAAAAISQLCVAPAAAAGGGAPLLARGAVEQLAKACLRAALGDHDKRALGDAVGGDGDADGALDAVSEGGTYSSGPQWSVVSADALAPSGQEAVGASTRAM